MLIRGCRGEDAFKNSYSESSCSLGAVPLPGVNNHRFRVTASVFVFCSFGISSGDFCAQTLFRWSRCAVITATSTIFWVMVILTRECETSKRQSFMSPLNDHYGEEGGFWQANIELSLSSSEECSSKGFICEDLEIIFSSPVGCCYFTLVSFGQSEVTI